MGQQARKLDMQNHELAELRKRISSVVTGGVVKDGSGMFVVKGKVRTVSGAKLSVTSGVFIAKGNVKRTSEGAYVIKGMVRDLFGASRPCMKKAATGVDRVKGSLTKLDMSKKSASSGMNISHGGWRKQVSYGSAPHGYFYRSHGYHWSPESHGYKSYGHRSHGYHRRHHSFHSYGNGMKHFSWKKHSSSKRSTGSMKKHFSSKKSAANSFHVKEFF